MNGKKEKEKNQKKKNIRYIYKYLLELYMY